ncbi:hypothetical protein [Leptotrichia trevisanii]|nr:hypothetical protein [Leptotrichia trevisanii]
MEEMKEKAKKSMEEAILEWADIELEIRCKRKMDIVMKELKSSREASNFFADLLVETQKTFFKLGKQVARMEMEE